MRIDLHLGVHKTATTHLQRHWVQCAALPGAAACPPLQEVRNALTPVVYLRQPPARAEQSAAAAAAWLSAWPARTGRLVLSEENLIGDCGQLFERQALYPDARERLERVAALLPQAELRLWLCVREYGAFIRSAHSETLRHGPYRPFRAAYTGFDLVARGWPELVADVQAAFPGARLHLWRYESLAGVREQLTATLFDLPPERQPAPDDSRDRQSLSRMAARLLDDLFQKAGPEVATKARPSVERIVNGPNFPRFDPWRADERAHFQRRYEQDIDRLRRLPAITWLG